MKNTKIFLVILLVICFGIGSYSTIRYFQHLGMEHNLTKTTHKVRQITERIMETKDAPNMVKPTDINTTTTKSRELILALQQEYDNTDIIGFMELGGIKEPIVYSVADDGYISRDLDKKYSEFGTIFLYKENTSIFDPVITLFGHNVVGHDTKFSRLANYERYQNELKTLRLHTENGLFIYEEQIVAVLDGLVYDKYNTWSYSGLNAFVNDLPDMGTVLYDSTNTLDSNAKYVVLSTCRDPKGVNVVVALYKRVAQEEG